MSAWTEYECVTVRGQSMSTCECVDRVRVCVSVWTEYECVRVCGQSTSVCKCGAE